MAPKLTKNKIQSRIESLEQELAQLKSLVEGPVWEQLTGALVPIASMTNAHLRNAIRVVLRRDPRYMHDAERMLAFAYLIEEALARGLKIEHLAKNNPRRMNNYYSDL